MSPRTRVLAASIGSSPFDRGGAAPGAVTTPEVTAAALDRGVVPFIPSNLLGMAVILTVRALATWLPRALF